MARSRRRVSLRAVRSEGGAAVSAELMGQEPTDEETLSTREEMGRCQLVWLPGQGEGVGSLTIRNCEEAV